METTSKTYLLPETVEVFDNNSVEFIVGAILEAVHQVSVLRREGGKPKLPEFDLPTINLEKVSDKNESFELIQNKYEDALSSHILRDVGLKIDFANPLIFEEKVSLDDQHPVLMRTYMHIISKDIALTSLLMLDEAGVPISFSPKLRVSREDNRNYIFSNADTVLNNPENNKRFSEIANFLHYP